MAPMARVQLCMVLFSFVLANELFSLSLAIDQDHIFTLKHFQPPHFATCHNMKVIHKSFPARPFFLPLARRKTALLERPPIR